MFLEGSKADEESKFRLCCSSRVLYKNAFWIYHAVLSALYLATRMSIYANAGKVSILSRALLPICFVSIAPLVKQYEFMKNFAFIDWPAVPYTEKSPKVSVKSLKLSVEISQRP